MNDDNFRLALMAVLSFTVIACTLIGWLIGQDIPTWLVAMVTAIVFYWIPPTRS